MKNKPDHVDVGSAYSEEYRRTLNRINAEGECPAPFCKDSAGHHIHGWELVGEYWKVTRNTFNYQESQYPFLIIHRTHIEEFGELTKEAWAELHTILARLIQKFDLKGAGFVWRIGESSYTGASVRHLHAHLICGYQRSKATKQIEVLVGYKLSK